jgi:hypothetical protein
MAMPSLMRQRAASASRFGPEPPRSAAIGEARRGRGFRASIVLTSGHGTRGACGPDARNAKEDVDTDVDATNARRSPSRRRDGHVTTAARRRARRRRSGHGCAEPNGRERLRRRGFATSGTGSALVLKSDSDEQAVRRMVRAERAERGRGVGRGGTPGHGPGEVDGEGAGDALRRRSQGGWLLKRSAPMAWWWSFVVAGDGGRAAIDRASGT